LKRQILIEIIFWLFVVPISIKFSSIFGEFSFPVFLLSIFFLGAAYFLLWVRFAKLKK